VRNFRSVLCARRSRRVVNHTLKYNALGTRNAQRTRGGQVRTAAQTHARQIAVARELCTRPTARARAHVRATEHALPLRTTTHARGRTPHSTIGPPGAGGVLNSSGLSGPNECAATGAGGMIGAV
jgi:hypothetical protein